MKKLICPSDRLKKFDDHNINTGKLNFYNTFMISHFDHILNEYEAERLVLSYSFIDDVNCSVNKQYYIEENKFINLYKFLYYNYNLFYLKDSENNNIVEYYAFGDYQEFKNIVIESLREQEFAKIYIKELSLVLVGNYDLTVIVYTLLKKINDYFIDLIKCQGLFFLGETPEGQSKKP